jgi:tRNA (uracil-5-)-methyltransferase
LPVFEQMLSLIEKFAEIDDKTTLFDICCGTGAIGLCLTQATQCKKIIGVEICEEAVKNAKANVEANAS